MKVETYPSSVKGCRSWYMWAVYNYTHFIRVVILRTVAITVFSVLANEQRARDWKGIRRADRHARDRGMRSFNPNAYNRNKCELFFSIQKLVYNWFRTKTFPDMPHIIPRSNRLALIMHLIWPSDTRRNNMHQLLLARQMIQLTTITRVDPQREKSGDKRSRKRCNRRLPSEISEVEEDCGSRTLTRTLNPTTRMRTDP